jgi:uncharacterized protein (DUF488 family)
MKQNQQVVWGIGHSNYPIWYFRYKLLQAEIDVLVDVRTFPQSRFASQFNRRALQTALEAKGIQYLYFGKRAGGRGVNDRYEEAMDELAALVRSGKRICICCSEKSFEKCHRHTLLEPSFRQRGIDIVHILCDDAPKKAARPKQSRLFL